jgi:hypothetical protein
VREQLREGYLAERQVGQISGCSVGEVETSAVAQLHDQHSGECLGERPDAVLRVGGRLGAVDRAAACAPQHLPVPRDRTGQRRCSPGRLTEGDAVAEFGASRLEQFVHPAESAAGRDAKFRQRGVYRRCGARLLGE